MALETRMIESAQSLEIYISAVPQTGGNVEPQAEELFNGIRETLLEKNAVIMQERIFAERSAMDTISSIRSEVYGNLDDGVAPTRLVVPRGARGQLGGVQVYAVSSPGKPEVLCIDGAACGRVLRHDGKKYVTLSGVTAAGQGSAADQARAFFEKAQAALMGAGGDISSVVRTWVWLDDILSWYDDFNQIRTRFFTRQGLIDGNRIQHMPASTGVGITPSGGASCALDVYAVIEPGNSSEFYSAAGEQGFSLDYGSSFSRAVKAVTPAGDTLFVSGTAAIDRNGLTEHVGDIESQIRSAFKHIQAVLDERDCQSRDDLLQMVAYCKNTEVERVFNKMCSEENLPWPWPTLICHICRDDLLFEIEVVASTSAKRVCLS